MKSRPLRRAPRRTPSPRPEATPGSNATAASGFAVGAVWGVSVAFLALAASPALAQPGVAAAAPVAVAGTVDDGGPEADADVDDGGARPGIAGPLIEPALDRAFESGAGPTPVRACSFREALCVRAPAGTAASAILAALGAGERAWETLTGTLRLPPPDGDTDGRFVVDLASGVPGGAQTVLGARDPLSPFDRAASHARVDRALPPGCALDLALARVVARGSLWRAAPATDEGSARARSETLARLATPCAAGDEDVRVFQAHPERVIVDPETAPAIAFDRGATLFFDWLDRTFGAEPGALVGGLAALAPTRTSADAQRWAGAPTGFDVLRTSLKDVLWRGSTLDDIVVRFEVARAIMTPSPHVAWHVPWPDHARRLAAPEPVGPSGASYIVIDRQGAARDAKLRLEAEWEDYGRMHWVVVKLDSASRVVAEIPIASMERATHASLTVASLEGTDRVVVVGVGLGSTDHGFDPDQREWEPHGWLLTLAAE